MAHTYASILLHCVFSTKNREQFLSPEVRDRLLPYLGGIVRENDMKALALGGTGDHVHMLLSLPPAMSAAKALQLVKGGSSGWSRKTFSPLRDFRWQEGYGAFSVGISQVDDTIAYIQRQEEHRRKRSFEEECRAFLHKHGIEYDERYLLG